MLINILYLQYLQTIELRLNEIQYVITLYA